MTPNHSLPMRIQARDCLKRASTLLEAGDEDSLRYACLELRFCIEFLLLDRLRHYRDYLDDDVMAKWTPRQIITELLNVDPRADQTATISIGAETTPGEPAKHMHTIGEDRRLTLKWANTNWQALGNFLHAPTLQQIDDEHVPTPDAKKKRANEIAAHLDHVLKARIINFSGGQRYELTCPECGTHTKRLKAGVQKAQAFVCRNAKCQAAFDVSEKDWPNLEFTMRYVDVECDCQHVMTLKAHLAVAGKSYACEQCASKWEIRTGLVSRKLTDRPDESLAG